MLINDDLCERGVCVHFSQADDEHEVKGKSVCKEEDIVDYNINKEQATTFLILKANSRPNFYFRHDGLEKYF